MRLGSTPDVEVYIEEEECGAEHREPEEDQEKHRREKSAETVEMGMASIPAPIVVPLMRKIPPIIRLKFFMVLPQMWGDTKCQAL